MHLEIVPFFKCYLINAPLRSIDVRTLFRLKWSNTSNIRNFLPEKPSFIILVSIENIYFVKVVSNPRIAPISTLNPQIGAEIVGPRQGQIQTTITKVANAERD